MVVTYRYHEPARFPQEFECSECHGKHLETMSSAFDGKITGYWWRCQTCGHGHWPEDNSKYDEFKLQK